jgi:hypothetical protein
MNTYQKLAAWIQEQTKKIKYGEASIRVVIHAGKIKYFERNISLKDQPGGVINE